MATASTPGLSVELTLSGQWNGAFDGNLTIQNTSGVALSDWSVTLISQYQLRNISNFTVEQVQLADGSWQVTLSPPSWGTTLSAGGSASSYVQGVIPSGGQLSALEASEVLINAENGTPTPTPAPTPEPDPAPAPVPAPSPAPSPDPNASSGEPSSQPSTPTTAASGDLWSEQFFAPYVDMGLYPVPDLDGLARQYGVGLLTLGFLQATPSGQLGWAGLDALSLNSNHEQAVAIRNEIAALRASGGDVMVSLGGAAGVSLAQAYRQQGLGAEALAQAYGEAVESLGLRKLDFDIEGAAIAEPQTLRLQMQAIALLQQSKPELDVWLTLPVLPQGLTADGLNTVRIALEAGVQLDGVNVMAMDYGDSAAPPELQSMGAYAIDAARNTYSQLADLFATAGESFGWNQLGVTPMIGTNDVTSEVFTLADAQLLEDFARSQGLGMLSMWSLTRDNPGPTGQVTATHAGLETAPGAFTGIWGDYGSDPVLGDPVVSSPAPGETGSGNTDTNTVDSITGNPLRVSVNAGTSLVNAQSGVAEDFVISYSWGRQLVIESFDPNQDRLDLLGFWGEGQQAQLVDLGSLGTRIDLPFNQQQISLPGVEISQLGSNQLLIWGG